MPRSPWMSGLYTKQPRPKFVLSSAGHGPKPFTTSDLRSERRLSGNPTVSLWSILQGPRFAVSWFPQRRGSTDRSY